MKSGIIVFTALLLFLNYVILYSDQACVLSGNAIQGGIIIGTISDSVKQVFFDNKEQKISKNKFMIGFDRDELPDHELQISRQDGKIINRKITITDRKYEIQSITKVKKEYVETPIDHDLQRRISNESKSLKAIRQWIYRDNELLAENFVRPVEGGEISGVFGSRRILNEVPKKPHNGLDIAVPSGTPVKSMTSGTIVLTGHYYYNGKFVLIDHGLGLSSIYIHLDSIAVEIGQIVEAGEMIGKVGSTGRSTGPHLHWGVSYFEKRIDPALLLEMKNINILNEESK